MRNVDGSTLRPCGPVKASTPHIHEWLHLNPDRGSLCACGHEYPQKSRCLVRQFLRLSNGSASAAMGDNEVGPAAQVPHDGYLSRKPGVCRETNGATVANSVAGFLPDVSYDDLERALADPDR